MTRDQAMLKLLAVEPETRDRILLVTGWPAHETMATLERLVAKRRLVFQRGPYGAICSGLYSVNDAPSRSRADGDKGPR